MQSHWQDTDRNLYDPAIKKALGVYWDTAKDRPKIQVNVEEKPVTRRGLLFMINQVHDVLGLEHPFVLLGGKLLKEACRNEVRWDEPISDKYYQQWDSWVSNLHNLDNVTIPRSFKLPGLVCQRKELHVFCDASMIGYDVVCYVRTIAADQTINCTFCMKKSRVTR